MKSKSRRIFKILFLSSLILGIIALIYIYKASDKLYRDIGLNLIGKSASSITKIYYYDKDEVGNPIGEPIE